MFGAIKHLFQPSRPTANSSHVVEPIPACESLHWSGTGRFQLPVVGESYYRDAIARIAQNEPGRAAMAFCTARLVPEDLNPHDSNAIAVYVGESKVGHLTRDTAVEFRAGLSRLGHQSLPRTTCDAVILNGLIADGKAYEYSIELDLELDGDLPKLAVPQYAEAIRRDPEPPLRPRGVGLREVTVWMPHEALFNMDKRQRVESWTTDHWDSVNYYLRNSQGIGLGHKLVAVQKERHDHLFGDQEPEVTVVAIEGRMVTLLFRRLSMGF